MGGEVIQFVDSVSDTAGIRLSLTTAPWSVLFNGTDVSPPPLRRATVSTLLADGGIIPASAYDNRTVTLHLQLDHAVPGTSATQLQLLSRELDRPTNVLRWRPDPTLPAVYFRTFRSPDYALAADHGINRHEFTVQLVAEPFSIGVREDIAPVTVNSNPVSSNGRFWDITGVKGDVETPLMITIPAASLDVCQTVFGVRRRGTPSAAPFVIQAEAMSVGADTALGANSATYSGAGNNNMVTTFAVSPGLFARLTATASAFPATSVDIRGTYRVFARATIPSTIVQASFRLVHGIRRTTNATVTYTSGGVLATTTIDLGLVQIPEGVDPGTLGYSGAQIPAIPPYLEVQASRISGSGSVTWDYIVLVPADDCFSIVSWGLSPSTGPPDRMVFDGVSRTVYNIDSSGNIFDGTTTSFVGNPPMVSPGVTNRIAMLRNVTPNGVDAVTGSVAVTVAYWPRYLTVRPVST